MGTRLRSFAIFLLLTCSAHAQTQPECDVTCSPDDDSPTYGGTVDAKRSLRNARGLSSSVAPARPLTAAFADGEEPTSNIPGSESYNYAIPILHLPGRNGLDLNLTLYYNSRVWTIDHTDGTATFNADRDFPSYGFRLGFGYLEYSPSNGDYILVERDGTKHQLVLVAANSYDSVDNTYINYNSSTKVLTYKNGLKVTYEQFSAEKPDFFRPIKIRDTSGNFVSITYVANRDQAINTITDTLGRTCHVLLCPRQRAAAIHQHRQPHRRGVWLGNS